MSVTLKTLSNYIIDALRILFVFSFIGGMTAHAQTVVHTKIFSDDLFNDVDVASTRAGDGYIAIPFKDRFYYMYHHEPANNLPKFVCHEKNVSSIGCQNFGGASLLTNQAFEIPLPDGDPLPAGNPAIQLFSSTADANEEYQIIADQYLYYPVTRYNNNSSSSGQTALDWGAGCFDLVNNTECGFKQLSSNPNARSFYNAIEGPFGVGNNLYFLDLDSIVHCITVDPNSGSMADCSGTSSLDLFSNALTRLPRFTAHWPNATAGGQIGGEVVDDQLFLTLFTGAIDGSPIEIPAGSSINGTSAVKVAICIDTIGGTTLIPCNSWNSVNHVQDFATFEGRRSNISNYLYFDLSMNPIAICNRGASLQSCIRISDGSDENSLADVASASGFTHGLGTEVVYNTKSYFPEWAGSELHCFDWSLGTTCPGIFPIQSEGATLAGSNPQDYTLNIDAANCIWALGHANNLYSLSPITDTAPCNTGVIEEIARIEDCEQPQWLEINVANVNQSSSILLSLTLEVLDSNGNSQTTDLLTNSTVNLQTPAFAGLTQIEYKITAQFVPGSTGFPQPAPILTITADENGCNGGSTLKICKVAGPDVEIGAPFTFGASSGDTTQEQINNMQVVTVPAGPAPGGYCQIALTGLDANEEVVLGEMNSSGYRVIDITTAGAGTIDVISVEDRFARFGPIGEGVTEVTFTNEKYSGYLEICKKGEIVGNFEFELRNADTGEAYPRQTVPAGACSPAIEVTAGNITITEVNGPGEFKMTTCEAIPSSSLINCNTPFNTMQVSVAPGGIANQTIAIVENCPAVRNPRGQQICLLTGVAVDPINTSPIIADMLPAMTRISPSQPRVKNP